tara:strand:+ start:6124 stop:6411 length:288 start_codon:yes stop_codon:yes gene_type:complete
MSDSVKKWHEMQESKDERIIQNPYFKNASTTSPIVGDPIVTMVKEKFDLRSKVGIDKYNTTLFDSPDGFYKFLNHLQEELMDATLYIEKLRHLNK